MSHRCLIAWPSNNINYLSDTFLKNNQPPIDNPQDQTSSQHSHELFMAEAIIEAQKAADLMEVPVGAVVVLNGEIIGRGFNQPISSHDPCAHAEVMALRDAAKRIENYRLVDADLYVTIEPCTMCSGAIVHARIKRVIFAALEPKAGVVCSQMEAFKQPYFNHEVEVISGILEEQSVKIMQDFFKMRRAQKKQLKKEAREALLKDGGA